MINPDPISRDRRALNTDCMHTFNTDSVCVNYFNHAAPRTSLKRFEISVMDFEYRMQSASQMLSSYFVCGSIKPAPANVIPHGPTNGF